MRSFIRRPAASPLCAPGDVKHSLTGRTLIGPAGPRVIQDTIRQQLPEGAFESAGVFVEHGMVDKVCPRDAMRETISTTSGYLLD
ncbi:MAG: hypothetical protein R3A47_04840 [Polyangiales bacterium]